MDRQLLKEYFNLTETELSIYLTLLSVDESTASNIAIKNNLNRTFTYDIIQSLIKKGLVSFFIKDNKKYFRAADPSQLSSLLKLREEKILQDLKEKQTQISTMIPELKKLKQPTIHKTHVEVYTTKKGIRTVLNLILKEKKPIMIYGNIELFKKTMESYFEIWNSHRIKNKINTKILTSSWINIKNTELDLLSEQEQTNSTTFTFSDKVIIVFWQDVPTAILIQNILIADDQRILFDNLWKRDVKIYTGKDGIAKAYHDLIKKKSDTIYGYGFSEFFAQKYGMKISDEWHTERLNNNVICKFISHNDSNSIEYFNKRMNKWKDFNIKFLGSELCGPTNIVLSSKMIASIIYTEKNIRVFVNTNSESVNAHKKHFLKLWQLAKK